MALIARVILVLAFLVCSLQAKNVEEFKFISNEDTLVTGVFSNDSKAKSQVVIWFHGAMSSARCNKGLEAGRGFLEFVPQAIVISPSACKNENWLREKSIQRIDSVLNSLEEVRNQQIDSVYLVGVSDGALGVFAYSVFGKRNIKSRLLVSGFLKALGEPFEFQNIERLKKGSWWLLQGAQDRLYPADLTFLWNREFCKISGMKCVLHEDIHGEHDWSYWVKNHRNWILEFARQINQ